jgi:hypothetical protein
MEEGFTVDQGDGGRRVQSTWFGGKPVRSFWGGVKLSGVKPTPIETWRCRQCGYLESYAPNAQTG